MSTKTTALIFSVALNIFLALFLFKGCNCNCEDAVVVKRTVKTIKPVESRVVPTVTETVPIPRKVTSTPVKLRLTPPPAGDKQPIQSFDYAQDDSQIQTDCDEEVFYSDTIRREDEYKAVIEETVSGNRIAHRKISFFNLTPRVVETIEKIIPIKERVRLYAGVFAGVEGSYSQKQITGWSAGPELALTFPVGAMVGVAWDARNNGGQVHFLYKIKLRK